MGKYDDMLSLPHPTSRVHPRMPAEKRAAQFAPFAALTGFDDIITEKGRVPGEDIQLSEEEKEVLDRKLGQLAGRIAASEAHTASAEITYFEPDDRKAGGAMITLTGTVVKVNAWEKALVLEDGLRIGFDYIRDLTVSE